MFNSATDPLGISLKARAADHRRNYEIQNLGFNMGPLKDPMWDGLFQAYQEAGVDNLADDSVGAHDTRSRDAMWDQAPPTPQTFGPYQGSALAGGFGMAPKDPTQLQPHFSSHLGAPADRFQARPLQGLIKAGR